MLGIFTDYLEKDQAIEVVITHRWGITVLYNTEEDDHKKPVIRALTPQTPEALARALFVAELSYIYREELGQTDAAEFASRDVRAEVMSRIEPHLSRLPWPMTECVNVFWGREV